MRVNYVTTAAIAVTLSTSAMVLHADNNMGHNWTPQQPQNMYWQAPNFNFPPTSNTAPPVRNNVYRRPMAPPPGQAYRQPPRPAYNYPAPNNNANNRRPNNPGANRPNMNPNANFNSNRGYPPPPRGPYARRPDSGASAYNVPGYNRYRNNRNSGWDNNKFWGKSGPSRWMNPSKKNMEQGWDDMINAPSRMGDDMPGGWSAPEVSMPNPVDMGDQMQDNVKDLPEQIRNMDVGNE